MIEGHHVIEGDEWPARTAEGRWETPPSVALAMFDASLDALPPRKALHSTVRGQGVVARLREGKATRC